MTGKGRDRSVVGDWVEAQEGVGRGNDDEDSGAIGSQHPDTPRTAILKLFINQALQKQDRWLAIIARRIPRGLRQVIEARDMLQDVLIDVIRRQTTFRGNDLDSFERWFATIVAGTIAHEVRRAVRQEKQLPCVSNDGRPSKEGCIGMVPLEPVDYWPGPEEQCILGEEASRILDEVASLPTGLRFVFAHRVFDGQSISKIAAALGVTSECVSSRLAHAKRALRLRLEKTDIRPR